MANRFSVDTVFRGIDHMSGTMTGISAKAKAFEKSLQGTTRSATDLVEKPLGALMKVGALAAGGVAVAGGGIIEVMKTGMTFEKALLSAGNKFEAGISKTSETFKKLKVTAQEVGGSTEFSATQAAGGLKELAGAGLSAEQSIAALRGTVDLATAAEISDMAAATEVAVKSLGAFGLKSKDPIELAKNLERVSDVLLKVDDISSTSVLAFYEAIAEGGAVARTAGADIETFGALVAGVADVEQGSKAGTSFKNVFTTLSAPTKEAAKAFKRLNIETVDSQGNTRDAIKVFGELRSATAKMGTGEKTGILEEIFGKIPLSAVATVMANLDEIAANRDKALRLEARGSVKKKATSMRSGGTNAWDEFTSGVEAVSLAVFDLIGGPVTTVISRMTEWIGKNRDFMAGNFAAYINGAIPIVESFGKGVHDAFTKAWPIILGVKDALLSVFGGDDDKSPEAKARGLGSALTTTTLVLGGLWLMTKAASAATFVYGAMTKGLAAAVWLSEVAFAAAKTAIFWYNVWTTVGTKSTFAMAFASAIATGSMITQKASAFGAAVGMKALAVASWAASAPVLAVAAAIASLLLAAYALYDFARQNGGLEGIGGFLGVGTDDWGFEGVDQVMNRQAKARRANGGKVSAADLASSEGSAMDMAGLGDLERKIKALQQSPGMSMPPGMDGGMSSIPGMPPNMSSEGPTAEPQVALKDESSAKLSQNLSRDIATNLKGSIKIEIKDKGGNADVSSSTGPGVEVNQSGGF
jgi:TP901 family phage tail tape measure protein